jgi:hypothetical protein
MPPLCLPERGLITTCALQALDGRSWLELGTTGLLYYCGQNVSCMDGRKWCCYETVACDSVRTLRSYPLHDCRSWMKCADDSSRTVQLVRAEPFVSATTFYNEKCVHGCFAKPLHPDECNISHHTKSHENPSNPHQYLS